MYIGVWLVKGAGMNLGILGILRLGLLDVSCYFI